MTRADRIAMWTKANSAVLVLTGERVTAVVLGRTEFDLVSRNREPCDPPDLSPDRQTFCGLKLIHSDDNTRHSICIDL